MDRDRLERQAALRARADEVIRAAQAAAGARVPSPHAVVADTMKAITLACWDPTLAPADRLALIDDAQRLMIPLKELAESGQPARPALLVNIFRGTNDLLRRYAALIRDERK